jgi:long-chain acyl-CoA synthetase
VNLARIIDGHDPGSVALHSRGRTTTYGELADVVGRLRGGLAGIGLVPGDRVGIAAANNRIFVRSYLAVLGAGCVAVPLNPTSPAPELQRELAAVGARALLVGPAAASAAAGLDRAALPELAHLITAGSAGSDVAFADLEHAEPAPVVDRSVDDLAVLMFTAGTAGNPKAAMLTHTNLLANIDQSLRGERQTTSEDVVLCVLPMFHIYGLNVCLGITLAAGGSVVLGERFDPTGTLELVERHGCTVVAGAPPMWSAWADLPGVTPERFASIRFALSGASPLPVEVAVAARERLGLTLHQGYGLTEASPIVTSSGVAGAPPGSVGRPLPGVEVRLVDADGEDAELGDQGEVWVRGQNVFPGYWQDPEATAAALTPDGWLRTGDVGVADEDGNLWIVDRAKDLIIVSGFNVYPAEVEEVLLEHPGVEAVAVVGVPHPHVGEAVKAFVVAVPGHHLEEDELIEHCATDLARYKCPDSVAFVDEIPTGMGGKILRRSLR